MAERLKDLFFTDEYISDLSQAIKKNFSAFDPELFQQRVFTEEWKKMELKEMMHHITRSLCASLPEHYPTALGILEKTAPAFEGFDAMIFPDFVEQYGLDYWDISLNALGKFTCLCSSEFAIRPFIIKDQRKALETMLQWSESEGLHKRRLASEGCRPRLPWAPALPALKKDPTPILPILENLKDDPQAYVQKSVANNMNDISKDHPLLVLEISEKWFGKSKNTDWIVKRACRSLLKQGDTRAMILFGFGDPGQIVLQNLALDPISLKIGEELQFSFEMVIQKGKPRKVRLEYAVEFVKAKGKVSRKIFHIKEGEFKEGTHLICKRHPFRDLSTRKHYPGKHRISIVINGVEKISGAVNLFSTKPCRI